VLDLMARLGSNGWKAYRLECAQNFVPGSLPGLRILGKRFSPTLELGSAQVLKERPSMGRNGEELLKIRERYGKGALKTTKWLLSEKLPRV
jgi:hypothetical protein